MAHLQSISFLPARRFPPLQFVEELDAYAITVGPKSGPTSTLTRIIGVRLVSMSMSWRFVYASIVTAGLLRSSGIAGAEELGAEQARAFVVGKLFAFTCFEGTTGVGRILSDGSVVGAVRIHGQGEPQFHKLPAGTVRIDGQFLCANVAGLPFTPCARVEKIDYRSFRSSLVGLSFAYCDFYQRNPRSHLAGGRE